MPRDDFIQFGSGEAETAKCGVCGNEMLAADHDAWGGKCFGCKLADEIRAQLYQLQDGERFGYEQGFREGLEWVLETLIPQPPPARREG